MEKVNEVGRFKRKVRNYMYSCNGDFFDLNLDLELLHPYRFDYVMIKEYLPLFLSYVKCIGIHREGIRNYKVKVAKHGKEVRCVYLTLNGEKEYVDHMDSMLRRLCDRSNELKG